mgnify:CR=1 FL=1
MSIRERLSGNEAVATAMKQINPDVVAAFPITPSTEIPQYFSTFVANGSVDTEFVAVESEHSAMSACIGAQAAGARAMTATSANGLSLMWEMIYIASSLRLPIVLSLVNRAVSGPINIHNDHSDAMGVRDAGWVMLFSENNQEAYDNMLMAHRIAEHKDVKLPLMVCQDGFITSHSIENIELIEDDKVKAFVGEYNPEEYLLNKENPISVGPLDLQAYLFEHKTMQADAMRNAKDVILEVLRQLSVKGGVGYIVEYAGEGVKTLSVPERATITNMGAELGATTSIFPSDEITRKFLLAQGREQDFTPLYSDEDAVYDEEITIDLSALEPMAAKPHSPDNVEDVKTIGKIKVKLFNDTPLHRDNFLKNILLKVVNRKILNR